jgi:predicted glutamine amidotransferase
VEESEGYKMCRLYAFQANELTKVECPLVYAQNALMMQSAEDESGLSHTHGWGIATYKNDFPHVERQAWAAYSGECFEKAAAKIYSTLVIAHVRRATMGEPAIRNTHPFAYEGWTFAHNGTVPGFKKFRSEMYDEIDENFRSEIAGETDSEHVFYFFLTLNQRYKQRTVIENLREAIQRTCQWSKKYAPEGVMGLNILLSDGQIIYGSRIGRSLYYAQHKGVYNCEICGFPHIHHVPSVDYTAIDIASEPITHDEWISIPDHSVFLIDKSFNLQIENLIGQ